MQTLPGICQAILAACIVHNICILQGDNIEDILLNQDIPEVPLVEIGLFQDNDVNGQLKRINITNATPKFWGIPVCGTVGLLDVTMVATILLGMQRIMQRNGCSPRTETMVTLARGRNITIYVCRPKDRWLNVVLPYLRAVSEDSNT